MVGRRAGTLVPLEVDILRAATERLAEDPPFHGFGLAQSLRGPGHRALVAHGTLYKALSRLQAAGFLTAVWEDAETASAAGRPRRKLYTVTAAGVAAFEAARRPQTAPARVSAEPRLT